MSWQGKEGSGEYLSVEESQYYLVRPANLGMYLENYTHIPINFFEVADERHKLVFLIPGPNYYLIGQHPYAYFEKNPFFSCCFM